jgi:hypothetical protein
MYDIPLVAKRFGGVLGGVYSIAFGQEPEFWKFASPITHIKRGKGIPPMIVAYSGGMRPRANLERVVTAEHFVKALVEAGVKAETLGAPEKTHFTIIQEFGQPGDYVGERIFTFFRRYGKTTAQ